MDTSSPEYIIVHRVLDTPPDYHLMLLRRGDEYRVLYECAVDPHILLGRWYSIDRLAWWGIRYLELPFDTFVEMGEFIREYVGEARWILAVLVNT